MRSVNLWNPVPLARRYGLSRFPFLLLLLVSISYFVGSTGPNTAWAQSEPAEPVIANFRLIDGMTGQPVPEFAALVDGAEMNLASLPAATLNLEAEADPAVVKSVYFELNGNPYGVDNEPPFILAGDDGSGSLIAWTPAEGSYSLMAIPYSEPDQAGIAGAPWSVSFSVVAPQPAEPPAPEPTATPAEPTAVPVEATSVPPTLPATEPTETPLPPTVAPELPTETPTLAPEEQEPVTTDPEESVEDNPADTVPPAEDLNEDAPADGGDDEPVATYPETVDIFDLSRIASRYGTNDPDADLNKDGKVDVFDLAMLANQYLGQAPADEPVAAPLAAAACGDLVQEAELGALSGLFKIAGDSAASGGKYILVPNNTTNRSGIAGNNDKATFCFTVITAGTYRLKGRVAAPDTGSNAFFAQIDGQPAAGYKWNVEVGSSFHGDYVNDKNTETDPVEVSLGAGLHTVVIYLRQDGTRLDRLTLELIAAAPGGSPLPTPAVPPVPTPTTPPPAPTPTTPPPAATTVKQWAVTDLSFTANQTYRWQDFPLQVTFTNAQSGSRLTLDGYWDGGNTWRVRFAPPQPGTWNWVSNSPDAGMNNRSGRIEAAAPTTDLIAANPNYRGHLTVSSNGRYFVYADGSPFFWLGDTSWWLNSLGAGLEAGSHGRPFYEYLNNRDAKQFTVIQTMYFNLNQKNEGGYPFPDNTSNNGNFGTTNAGYWKYMDVRMQEMWNRGFVVAGHPQWFGGLDLNPAMAKNISRYLLARYGAYNLVWSLSGEYQYGYDNSSGYDWSTGDWNSLGDFVQSHNPYNHPVTIHPSSNTSWDTYAAGAGQQSSSGEFHDQGWLNHNWLQTGHQTSRLQNIPKRLKQDYALSPAKPVSLAEGWYENKDKNDDPPTPEKIRWQAWATFLNGGAGYTYGAYGLIRFYNPDVYSEPPVSYETTFWYDAIDSPGGVSLRHVVDFFNGINWWKLEPHRDWVKVNGEVPAYDYVNGRQDPHMATIGNNSKAIIFIPEGNSGKTITVTHLQANQAYEARWFNPRDGSWSTANLSNPAVPDANGVWKAPARPSPADGDWVLQLVLK